MRIAALLFCFALAGCTEDSRPKVKTEIALSSSAVFVTNRDDFIWPRFEVYINDGDSATYEHTLEINRTARIPLTEFAHGEKRFNPYERKVVRAEIVVDGRAGAGFSFK